jgi:hypothetical protein
MVNKKKELAPPIERLAAFSGALLCESPGEARPLSRGETGEPPAGNSAGEGSRASPQGDAAMLAGIKGETP